MWRPLPVERGGRLLRLDHALVHLAALRPRPISFLRSLEVTVIPPAACTDIVTLYCRSAEILAQMGSSEDLFELNALKGPSIEVYSGTGEWVVTPFL